MENTKDNYSVLIQKLDAFIRKFYINKAIRGSLYFVGSAFLLFLVFSILEYQFYFPKVVRKALFYSFLFMSIGGLIFWVLKPLMQYFKLGKTISHENAARIIGTHFSNVEDKLLNVLQLKQQSQNEAHRELIEASIEQKSENIRLVPFKNAIDLTQNRKYLKYALPPFLLFLVLLFAAPSLIKDSTYRIINNHQAFEREQPFSFNVDQNKFEIVQYDDFTYDVQVTGDVLPTDVFIQVNNYPYKMQNLDGGRFRYTFKNINSDKSFHVFAGDVQSEKIDIAVIERPVLLDFTMFVDYPSYTGIPDKSLQNIGNVTLPEGSILRWNFESVHTDSIFWKTDSNIFPLEQKEANQFAFSKRILKQTPYTVFLKNNKIATPDSLSFYAQVISDQYPSIEVQSIQDSAEQNIIYYIGEASDDYGIRSIRFAYTITDDQGTQKTQHIDLKTQMGTSSTFEYILDIESFQLKPGDRFEYHFEVADNDAINGSKTSKTTVLTINKRSVEEEEKRLEEQRDEIKDDLKKSLEKTKELKDAFKKVKEKLRNQNEVDWKTKQEIQKLLEEQKALEEQIQKAQQNFKDNKQADENKSPEMKEKEDNLEKMFDELLNKEIEELRQKIEDMMKDLEKEPALQKMEEMEQQENSLEKELERLKELYKELEVEKKVEKAIEDLEKLATEQKKLSRETKDKKQPDETLKEKQEELDKKFDKLQEDMKQIEKENNELERPKNLGKDNQDKMEDIDQDMQQAGEKLDQQDNEDASKKQKDASEKMEEMASSLKASMEQSDEEGEEEDMKMIRQLLENLITLSFDQEDLIDNFKQTDPHIPQYVSLVQDQFKIKDDFKIVSDSLQELAKRQDKIESFVLQKMTEIQSNLEISISKLEERKKKKAHENQRKIMTGLNDLALMLDESMNNMQQKMSQKMQGSQMCNKPGSNSCNKPGGSKSGSKPADKISKGQEGLNKAMKKMMEQMKNGKKGKPGKEGKEGEDGMAKQFAQAAAKQAALRKALEQMKKESTEQGKGDRGLQEIIEQMDKIETDLVNKRLNSQLLERQKEILTRLLETEKADRQQDMDEKRKAERGSEKVREIPPSMKAYLKKRQAEIDGYRTVSPALKPYYKHLVEQYYKTLNKTH